MIIVQDCRLVTVRQFQVNLITPAYVNVFSVFSQRLLSTSKTCVEKWNWLIQYFE